MMVSKRKARDRLSRTIISPRDPMVAPWSSSVLSGEGCMKHTVPWINVVQEHLRKPKNLPGLIK